MEECGVFGIHNFSFNKNTIKNTVYGLSKLQHRGVESCGIGYFIENQEYIHKKIGLVKDSLLLDYPVDINIKSCIGHVRYSTSGKSKNDDKQKLLESQPLFGTCKLGKFLIAHNGNIPNIKTHDTQYILNFIEQSKYNTWIDILTSLMKTIKGVYCLLILTDTEFYVMRDRFGVRPLCIAKSNLGWCVSSESTAIGGYEFYRNINPGEIVRLNDNSSYQIYNIKNTSACVFEFMYFMMNDSISDNYKVSDIRLQYGYELAKNETIKFNRNDTIVIGSPNSGIQSGIGYAKFLNLRYEQFMKKRPKSQRTFILPNNNDRIVACRNKFIINSEYVKDKVIILIDDSIVRGNTINAIIQLFRECNVKEIHVRISSPPIKNPCYFGVDFPSYNELIAYNKNIDEIKDKVGCDSLKYLNIDNVYNVMKENGDHIKFCGACFDGKYNKELLDW